MKKIFIILMLFISMVLIINRISKNDDVLVSNTSSTENSKVKINSDLNNKTTSQNKNNDKSTETSELEIYFDELSQEELRYVQRDCGDYLYNNTYDEEYLEDYKKKYAMIRKTSPSEQQIKAVMEIVDKCNNYRQFQSELEDIYFEKDLLLSNEVAKIFEQKGELAATKHAEDHLFDKNMSTRLSAIKLLQNKNWINSINESLNLPQMRQTESFSVMAEAIIMRECELGMFDCSQNSFTVLNECRISPLACNMDFRSVIELSLTGYQLDMFDKYLTYLRSLPPEG